MAIQDKQRLLALENDQTIFARVKPCKSCTNHEFYAKTNACVWCVKGRYKKLSAEDIVKAKAKIINGQRIKEARQEARKHNLKHYFHITPCLECSTHKRYVISGDCVSCQISKHANSVINKAPFDISAREKAKNNNQTYYTTYKPCEECGAVERFTKTADCAVCPQVAMIRKKAKKTIKNPRHLSHQLKEEAIEKGFTTYVSSTACRRCDNHVRYITTRCCTTCVREKTGVANKQRDLARKNIRLKKEVKYNELAEKHSAA